jgi:hypothetical protein
VEEGAFGHPFFSALVTRFRRINLSNRFWCNQQAGDRADAQMAGGLSASLGFVGRIEKRGLRQGHRNYKSY